MKHNNSFSFQWLQVASYNNIFLWDWKLYIGDFIFIYFIFTFLLSHGLTINDITLRRCPRKNGAMQCLFILHLGEIAPFLGGLPVSPAEARLLPEQQTQSYT